MRVGLTLSFCQDRFKFLGGDGCNSIENCRVLLRGRIVSGWVLGWGAVVELSFSYWRWFAGISGASFGVLVGVVGGHIMDMMLVLELSCCSSSWR